MFLLVYVTDTVFYTFTMYLFFVIDSYHWNLMFCAFAAYIFNMSLLYCSSIGFDFVGNL